MRGSTILLVFTSGLAAAGHYHGATGLFLGQDRINIFHGDKTGGSSERQRAFVGFETQWTNERRHKRGTPLFIQAMTQLLKTTLGFRWVQLNDGSQVQSFIKVGTAQDAFEDFNSFRPTGVTHVGDKFTGRTGNQAIGVVTASPNSPLPQLYIGNKRLRLIYYVETPEKAQLALRRLQTFSDLQVQTKRTLN